MSCAHLQLATHPACAMSFTAAAKACFVSGRETPPAIRLEKFFGIIYRALRVITLVTSVRESGTGGQMAKTLSKMRVAVLGAGKIGGILLQGFMQHHLVSR